MEFVNKQGACGALLAPRAVLEVAQPGGGPGVRSPSGSGPCAPLGAALPLALLCTASTSSGPGSGAGLLLQSQETRLHIHRKARKPKAAKRSTTSAKSCPCAFAGLTCGATIVAMSVALAILAGGLIFQGLAWT